MVRDGKSVRKRSVQRKNEGERKRIVPDVRLGRERKRGWWDDERRGKGRRG